MQGSSEHWGTEEAYTREGKMGGFVYQSSRLDNSRVLHTAHCVLWNFHLASGPRKPARNSHKPYRYRLFPPTDKREKISIEVKKNKYIFKIYAFKKSFLLK